MKNANITYPNTEGLLVLLSNFTFSYNLQKYQESLFLKLAQWCIMTPKENISSTLNNFPFCFCQTWAWATLGTTCKINDLLFWNRIFLLKYYKRYLYSIAILSHRLNLSCYPTILNIAVIYHIEFKSKCLMQNEMSKLNSCSILFYPIFCLLISFKHCDNVFFNAFHQWQ